MILPIAYSLLSSSVAARATFPPGCSDATYPNSDECEKKNWYLGPDAKDPCAPIGPYPVDGQQVYIKDAVNFCLLLPDPNSPYLKNNFYSAGKLPNILDGEGFVQAYCMGSYMTPGALPMPSGGIRSAHAITGVSLGGKKYIEISGTMDCGALNINCTQSAPGAYDDGGQYDTAPYINCGKEPYSGVDKISHPGMIDYVEQAGDGIFCMRVCEAGIQTGDPCDVKQDTKGCQVTMGVTTFGVAGFDTLDKSTGQKTTYQVSLPPLTPLTPGAVTPNANGGGSPTSTSGKSATASSASSTSSNKSNGELDTSAFEGLVIGAVGAVFALLGFN